MRLELNLATRPYQNAREFYTRWGAILGLTLLISAVLITLAARGWKEAHQEARMMEQDRREISKLQKEAAEARQVLERPPNRVVADQAAYLNELIARKAFSWTAVFADLEKIMPAELRVMAMQPALNSDNQLELRLTIEGNSRDRIVQLLRKMEESPRFREPQLRAETTRDRSVAGAPGGGMQFQISALYQPQPANVTAGGTP